MTPRILVPAIAVLAALLAVPPLVNGANGAKLKAKLNGAQEAPGPGDPDGRGNARVNVKIGQRKLCVRVAFSGIDDPIAAHIHRGRRGVAGPVVVALWEGTPVTSPTRTCATSQRRGLLRKIARSPRRFYINLHNADYPDGAIRGQLKRR